MPKTTKAKAEREEKLSYAPVGLTGELSNDDLGFYPHDVKPRSHPDLHQNMPGVVSTQESEPAKPAPTLYETTEANFKQYNTLIRSQIGANRLLEDGVFKSRIGWEEGYDPVAEGMLDGVPEPLWGRVLAQTSKAEATKVIGRINQELKDADVTARSGWVANLTTTLGASILDPTLLIPAAQTLKYAEYGTNITKNALLTAASLGPVSALQNAVLVGTKETQGFNDWFSDTLTETLFATAIGGALGGFATKELKAESKNAKAFFKASLDDIDIKEVLSKDGQVTGLAAVPAKGNSAGAAKAEVIQAILDSGDVNFKDSKWVRKLHSWGTPVIDGLTSKYKVVSDLTDKLIPHNFKTAGGNIDKIGGLSARDFQKQWQGLRESASIYQDAQWLDYIGVAGLGKQVRGEIGSWTGKHMSKKEFGEQVTMAMRRGGKSEIPQIASAAKRWRDEVYEPLWKETIKRHPALVEHNYTNIIDYMNRVYDKNKIINKPEDFLDEAVGYLTETNAKVKLERNTMVASKNEVIRLEKQIKTLEAELGDLSVAKTSELKELLAEAKLKYTKLEENLIDGIKSGRVSPDMLQPRYLKKVKGAGENLSLELGSPKLRKSLSKKQIKDVANSFRDTVLQLNEEQFAGAIFENIKNGGNDIMQSRTFLWNDAIAEKWLVNDIETLSGLYVDQLSKRIYLEDVLSKYGDTYAEFNFEKTTKGIGTELKKQHDIFEKEILKKPESAERAKELQKLNKDTKHAADFLEKMFKSYLGNYVDKSTGAYRVTGAIKQFSAGALLGNVPILMFSDFFSPMFKLTFKEYIGDGVGQALSRMKSVMSGRAKELGENGGAYVRGAFADAGLGNNVANGNRIQAMFGYGAQYQPKTILERYISNVTTFTQNLNFVNPISDFQETSVAFASQSKIIRACEKYLGGEGLNKFEIGHLDEVRLQPKRWANRIVEQYKKYGQEIDGAFVGNYHLWDDAGAAMQMKGSIAREVRGLIIRPDLLEQPFAFKDPILSLATQFTSWIFSATLKYTIPTLTDFDQQKMIGILLMMGSASLIDPMRQLAKGEEVDLSTEALLTSALNNSGPLGWQFDALMRANARIDAPALRGIQPDRFKRKASGALDLGPASGIFDMVNNLTSAVVNGEMNEKDARNAMKLFIPFSNTLPLRKGFNEMLKSFNLPENRAKARRRKE